MRPFWTFRLVAAGAMAFAGSSCGRSGSAVHHDGAAGLDAPASTGGISGGSSGSVGGQSSGGTGSGGATSVAGSGGTATGGAGGAGGIATGAAGGTASGGAGEIASGGAGATAVGASGGMASDGAGGTATSGVGGTGSGGSGGAATGGAGGSATGGSAGSGGTVGGSTGSGGVAGSGGDGGLNAGGDGGDGAVDAADSDGGAAVDTYSGCYHVGDPSDFVEIIKTSAQGMCVRLVLERPYGPDTFGLTLPTGWYVWYAYRWPSTAGPCTTTGAPRTASLASSGTGTVTFNGQYARAGFTVDVDAVLTFPQGDSGASESETLQAKALPASGSCE